MYLSCLLSLSIGNSMISIQGLKVALWCHTTDRLLSVSEIPLIFYFIPLSFKVKVCIGFN